jgi:hypothetical protein
LRRSVSLVFALFSLHCTYEVVRQRRQLFDSRDSDIRDTLVLSFLQQLVVYLTGTQDMTPDLFWCDEVLGVDIRQVSLEDGLTSHFLEIRSSHRVTEQVLREEDNQWLSEFPQLLSSENVEVVGRSRRVYDLHVAVLMLSFKLLGRREDSRVVIGQLQESLQSAGRVFRSLTIVTVGQRED